MVAPSQLAAISDCAFYKDDQYLLNCCTKYLARFNTDARHAIESGDPASPNARIAEAWRFPVIDGYGGGAVGMADPATYSNYNQVTFLYAGKDASTPASVAVIGTFATLYEPIPLKRVKFEDEATRYWSVTYVIPTGQIHLYKFLVDGVPVMDPVNPQLQTLDNKAVWSRFFTDAFTSPVVFERWELDILYRLSAEILPFQTPDATNFLGRFYDYLDRQRKESVYNNVYRMDDSVGEVNFVDNILAREERHRLNDYKICLRLIDRVLRQRNPFMEPSKLSREYYFDLYNEMASNQVAGWNYGAYGSPQFFLYLLRRHIVTGAFCHPKYGGNAGAAGWAYLAERYRAASAVPEQPGPTLFQWSRSLEPPLGTNADYLG